MAGHNKWSKIKHKKAAADAVKSKVFSKMARLITLESRKCGGDTSSPGLSKAIERAKSSSMPKENIERAIAKGVGTSSENLEEIVYETYGPGGVAVIITTLTDNKNRTSAEIKHILSKNNCELATPGSALWAFTVTGGVYKPTSFVEINESDCENLINLLEQIDKQDDVQETYTNMKKK